jgi:DNA polymerase (family 10)
MSEKHYVDAKGRTRWHCNDALADKLKELYDYLVIGNYEESHAARYPRLAHTISRHPESIEELAKEGRLTSISGISKIIEGIITELLETGSCKKMDVGDEFFTPPPRTVLELTKIPRLGAKTARTLYQHHGIDGLDALARAIEDGSINAVKGVGKAMVKTMKDHIEAR